MTLPLILRQLTLNDETAFMDGLRQWENESLHWYTFAWKPGMNFSEMITTLEKQFAGIDLQNGFVPHSMLYAFVDGEIVGRASVRHRLNEKLQHRGGHLGYAVAPKFRRQGYAKAMVAQALDHCRSLRIPSVMITCSDDNIPSWKIIEHFDGKLQDKIWDEEDGETIRRYWLKI